VREYRLEREQWIPGDLDRVFGFFSDAGNLADITPPWMGFRVLTPTPVEMREGLRLDYRIRLAILPLRWRTQVTEWKPPYGFVDVQERGPFKLWEHTHRFRPMKSEVGEGVLVTDVVRYGLPLGPIGRLAHGLAVRAMLASVFDYRRASIRNWLG